MSASLQDVCGALGVSRPVSLCRDVLGFDAEHLPAALSSTRPRPEISLNRFVQLLRSRHFHVRLILAGADLLTANDEDIVDYGVFRLRDIYASNGIGIGVVSRDRRTAANSGGHATVTTSDQIDATGHDLTADGDFVPVVLPANMNVATANPDGTMNVTLGRSPVSGPCSPRNRDGMNSVVVDFGGETGGRSLAHEVGHYLGADHPATAGNTLMTQTGSVPGDPFLATTIIDSDRTTMLGHCTMRPAIPNI